MNRTPAFTTSAAMALLAVGFARPVYAYTGDDPVFATGVASCGYNDIQAHIGPSGAVTYKVYGTCSGSVVSGQMAYSNGRFQESFIISNQAKISTLGYCDTDPWATAVNCHDQKVQSSAINLDPGLFSSAPLSLVSGYSAQKFHEAFLNASRPNPPGIPVNLSSTYALGRVSAKWLAPDASGDRPFLGFLVQVRPQNAEGAAWTDIGTVPWHAALDYRLTAKVPANPAIPAWEVRVCSTTTLTASCSPAQTPTGAELVTKYDSDSSAVTAALLAAQPAPSVAFARVKTTVRMPAATEAATDRRAETTLLQSDAPKALGRVRMLGAAAVPVAADAPAPPVRAPHDLVIGRISYTQDDQRILQPVVGKPVTIACSYFVNEVAGPFNVAIQPWQGLILVGGQVPQTIAFQGDRRGGEHEARQPWTPSTAGVTPISCLLNPGFEQAEASSGNNRWNENINVVEAVAMPAAGDDAPPPAADDAPPPPDDDAAPPAQ